MQEKKYAVILPPTGHDWLVRAVLREVRILCSRGICVVIYGSEWHKIHAPGIEWYAYEQGQSESAVIVNATKHVVEHVGELACIVNCAGWKAAQTLTLRALNTGSVPVLSVARFGFREAFIGYQRWKRFLRRERPVDHTLIAPRRVQWLALLPHLVHLACAREPLVKQRIRFKLKLAA